MNKQLNQLIAVVQYAFRRSKTQRQLSHVCIDSVSSVFGNGSDIITIVLCVDRTVQPFDTTSEVKQISIVSRSMYQNERISSVM
ncbi:hypothetical protein B4U80_07380 [Leptotrombidium deliense]|uniref:Uncharacterized protein n=1 Tax=Leptotrombidium deliense TaxID=299467 RepID=A0A443S3Z8_9ACAR|nr:hypothetical protein B4U80_07380 [Leptotrombidium deliense]